MQPNTPPNSSPLSLCRTWTPQLLDETASVAGAATTFEVGSRGVAERAFLPTTPTRIRTRPIEGCIRTPEPSSPVGSVPTPATSSAGDTLSAPSAALSSPATSSTGTTNVAHNKVRKPPSITPRKFRRFFTPRGPTVVKRRGVLNEITRSAALNRPMPMSDRSNSGFTDIPSSRKRAASLHDEENTSSPSSERRQSKRQNTSRIPPCLGSSGADSPSIDETTPGDRPSPPPSLMRTGLAKRGTASQVFQRELGDIDCSFSALSLKYPVLDWRTQTADICSNGDQVYTYNPFNNSIFAQAALNRTDKILVADEWGGVTVLEASTDRLEKVDGWFAHQNAAIDIAVSSDDLRVATAGSDHKGCVWDIETKTRLAVLPCGGSMRSIRFQPGNASILATSSRDGQVNIWDIRCSSGKIAEAEECPDSNVTTIPAPTVVNACRIASPVTQFTSVGSVAEPAQSMRISDRGVFRDNCPVVTALQFLPQGKEHLLLTAYEANATLKLWDIRAVRKSKPVSYIETPPAHAAARDYGVTSLDFSTDGARVYALCKDHTVYAYSTAHLALGVAPELDKKFSRYSRTAPVRQGLGPLYGFRHPVFIASSFWIKCAVRRARPDGGPELLAVGSNSGAPVLFPTDERFLSAGLNVAARLNHEAGAAGGVDADQTITQNLGSKVPGVGADAQSASESSAASPMSNDSDGMPVGSNKHVLRNLEPGTTPIFTSGTPLVNGHTKECTAVSWTASGRLATASDDYTVRVWGEDREDAARLRRGGWGGGQRWQRGWAKVEDDYDEDEW